MPATKTLVLLPGLDGTGHLFRPLQKSLGSDIETIVISYPQDEPLGYDALRQRVTLMLPSTPYVILAESFSGPIGIEIANQKPPELRALILSASFASNPRPWLSHLYGRLIENWISRVPIPTVFIRAVMTGLQSPAKLCQEVKEIVQTVDPKVMAFRLREVSRCDSNEALRTCEIPVFYLNAAKDRILGKKVLNMLTEIKQDITIIDVAGPHLLLQVCPEVCAKHIRTVFNKLN